jgi:U3 small nucleolar RNA-associated protein 7
LKQLKDKKLKNILKKSEKSFKNSLKSAEKNKLLLSHEESFLKEENFKEKTWKLSQKDLKEFLDLNTRNKSFSLDLDLGSYRVDYSRTGTTLALGGQKGHLSIIEWKNGKLLSEIFLREKIRDVKFINSGLVAVGQEKYTYIYDNQGVEIHQIRDFVDVTRLEFLNWHFLLVGSGNTPFIKWQDTSTGKIVAEYNSKLGSTRSMGQNPWNAVIHLGHNNGNVSMWSPSMSSPLVKMLCHSGPVQDVKVDLSGNYMATVGLDSQLKIWDVRTFKLLQHYYMDTPASYIDISQKGILAVGHGPHVSLYKDIFKEKQSQPYMKHLQSASRVSDLAFCPWEDILGLGHSKGFSSLIIPGSGEPNFDTMTANPYQTTKQRQESEVHALLDKLDPEMITLDPNIIGNIDDAPSHVIKQERKAQAQEKVEETRKKKKGKSSALRRYLKKQPNVRDAKRVRFVLLKVRLKKLRQLKRRKRRKLLNREKH